VAQSLGAVRDLDVLIDNAEKFLDALPEEERDDLDGLLQSWKSVRDKARRRLLTLLESKDYSRFKKRMIKFTEQHEKSAKSKQPTTIELHPYQVRHIAPIAILTRYETVRSFEAVAATAVDTEEGQAQEEDSTERGVLSGPAQSQLPPTVEQLHALRISGKYLRYTLEFFRDTLPPEAGRLIRDVTTMQDQLGALHDADVASGLIDEFIARQQKRRKKGDPDYEVPPGLAAYLEERQAAIRTIHADFNSTWATLQSPKWRARLAVVILA
jgi:CHAD domain-containing protein